MVIVEFAISPINGNVWAAKPAGWRWRPKELGMALIIPARIESMVHAVRLTIPLFEGGIEELPPGYKPVELGERKYSLPLNEILIPGWYPKNLEPFDHVKAQDKSVIYQPFINTVIDTGEKIGIFRNNYNMTYPYKARKIL